MLMPVVTRIDPRMFGDRRLYPLRSVQVHQSPVQRGLFRRVIVILIGSGGL